jgi:hypothetical protein
MTGMLGDDTYVFNAGDSATLTATAADGRQHLLGGRVNNTILYSVGDGTDVVTGPAQPVASTGNLLKISGATRDELSLGLTAYGELQLRVGASATDKIIFTNFDASDVLGRTPFDSIEFDDGDGFDVIEADAQDRVVFGTGIERTAISAKAISGEDTGLLGILVSLGNGEQMWLEGEGGCLMTKAIGMPGRNLRTACNGRIRRVESVRQSGVMARENKKTSARIS